MSTSKRFRTRTRVGWGLMLLAMVIGVLMLAAGPAAAAGTLDQSHESMTGSGAIDSFPAAGQTFTAGITGALDQVDLGLSRGTRSDASATIELRTTVDGLPTDTVLASAFVPTASIPMEPAFVPVPIGPVQVTRGVKYAVVMTGTGFEFHGTAPGTYAGGDGVKLTNNEGWQIDPADLAFRTYVTPAPKPCKLLRLSLTPPRPPITICI